jgi:uncharacterized protein (DUF2062 family)
VLVALLIAGTLFALISQPLVRKVVFVALALATGTLVTLLLKIWVDSFIGIVFGTLAGSVAFYWHTDAYDIFQFTNKRRERTKDRERYLNVRDEFDRL